MDTTHQKKYRTENFEPQKFTCQSAKALTEDLEPYTFNLTPFLPKKKPILHHIVKNRFTYKKNS